jgi:hypothetical protein
MKLTTVDGSGSKRVINIATPAVHKPTVFMPGAIPVLTPAQAMRMLAVLPKPTEPEPGP